MAKKTRTKKTSDQQYGITIKGQGSIELRGTPEFVKQHCDYLNQFAATAIANHVVARVAAGEDRATVVKEVLGAVDKAAKKAGLTANKATVKV